MSLSAYKSEYREGLSKRLQLIEEDLKKMGVDFGEEIFDKIKYLMEESLRPWDKPHTDAEYIFPASDWYGCPTIRPKGIAFTPDKRKCVIPAEAGAYNWVLFALEIDYSNKDVTSCDCYKPTIVNPKYNYPCNPSLPAINKDGTLFACGGENESSTDAWEQYLHLWREDWKKDSKKIKEWYETLHEQIPITDVPKEILDELSKNARGSQIVTSWHGDFPEKIFFDDNNVLQMIWKNDLAERYAIHFKGPELNIEHLE